MPGSTAKLSADPAPRASASLRISGVRPARKNRSRGTAASKPAESLAVVWGDRRRIPPAARRISEGRRPGNGRIGLVGWGTWIRTKINGVRVRRSTVELFPTSVAGGASPPEIGAMARRCQRELAQPAVLRNRHAATQLRNPRAGEGALSRLACRRRLPPRAGAGHQPMVALDHLHRMAHAVLGEAHAHRARFQAFLFRQPGAVVAPQARADGGFLPPPPVPAAPPPPPP